MSRVIITGASGGTPNRLEINRFVKHDKFFSLYIQALQCIQDVNQSDYQSYFQVGGIHGLPYTPWDGAAGNPNARWGGYCTHSSVLFPTWHRPYVMLYEQILQKHAMDIAATYTVNQAAVDLRQPYWDWAENSVPPDEVTCLANVTITGPSGHRISVANPLLQYRFRPIPPQFSGVYRLWPTTLRHPTTAGSDATCNVDKMRSILRFQQGNITDNTYAMLTRTSTWDAFSNTSATTGSTANSLEGIHKGIHDMIGGGGHMSDPGVAAFDPIFQLHHANVDRILSLWAALNPGVWVSRGDSGGTFTIPAGGAVDVSSTLMPFWNTQNTFWASGAIVGTIGLGYTYPEFNYFDPYNSRVLKVAIGSIINSLYGSNSFTSSATQAEPEPGSSQAAVAGGDAQSSNSPPNHGSYDWVARIQYKKFELGTSFSIPLFFGPVPDNPEEWPVSSNFVGAHHAFINGNPEECENCRNQADLIEKGFIHLNRGIAKHSGLYSLEENVIAPYLTKELNWRVIKNDGEPAELESLEVILCRSHCHTHPPQFSLSMALLITTTKLPLPSWW